MNALSRLGIALACGTGLSLASAPVLTPSPLEPFTPDANCLLLYHFDEGEGTVARDASGHGSDGEIQGAVWAPGRFGKALRFNGKNACVFRRATPAIVGLRQVTVECWFSQDDPTGRQFLVGKDVTFHFDLSDGGSTSMSLYNQGGGVANADNLRHQHLGATTGTSRPGVWHHNAVTYDGHHLSFFVDGVLRRRVEAARDFALGVEARGLWVGCYVGTDFWYSGRIDELRVSDLVRYDPEKKLKEGEHVFTIPGPTPPLKAVRQPVRTGAASLSLTLTAQSAGDAGGWVYLKSPNRRAAIVGRYELKSAVIGAAYPFDFDVSDELDGAGAYILALEPVDLAAGITLTAAALHAGDRELAAWSGAVRSRRTFRPPLLVPLTVGPTPRVHRPARLLLLPQSVDRLEGNLVTATDEDNGEVRLQGEGLAEYWFAIGQPAAYRVYFRYAATARRPCDCVIDGDDLNAYDMCALNRTGGLQARDALWEYQGTTTLAPGLHWLRVQDVLPDVYGIRLEPVPRSRSRAKPVPWTRAPVPATDFLAEPRTWRPQTLFGKSLAAELSVRSATGPTRLGFSVTFGNCDPAELAAGDAVRFRRQGNWDLEPFGRLRFDFEGRASGHVAALWLVDVKGDEKLLWRGRDGEAGVHQVSVPISFEGNDVFDPGRVVALCLDLDEGSVRPCEVNRFEGAIIGPVFDRRDELVLPDAAAVEPAPVQPPPRHAAAAADPGAVLLAPVHRPWTRPVVPEEHPRYASTEPRPVRRETLGYGLHFTGARGIAPNTLDDFHSHYDFGDVCWPHIGILPQRAQAKTEADWQQALKEFETRLEDVRDRGLLLFDIWGYVPYEPSFPWTVAPQHHEILLRVLGDRFLGYDNGEQDGRYIGSYADKGKATSRRQGWDDFVAWDEHVCGDSQNYMNATGSLNFSLYYGERGARLLGLETAQGLPSDTLMFAFLRGASKQYGRLTYQATSIWNRYGYNLYHDRKTDGAEGYGYGPSKGCSRSLHRRLFFCGWLEGQSIFGTETGQFTADRLDNGAPELSPLGQQHLDLLAWARQHPDRGVMYTPVAFLLDFHNGWNMPRHLYRGDKYKVWGKFPYERGDYLIDAIFRMVWPGYEDCSYWRNERGFVCATPYGDIFDVINNRCPATVLRQYAALMLLGTVEITSGLGRDLAEYVQAGGDLIIDAPQAGSLPPDVTGVAIALGEAAKGRASRLVATGQVFPEPPYTYARFTATTAVPLLLSDTGDPLLTVNQVGKGRVIVAAAADWMSDALTYRTPEIVDLEPPYRLLNGLRTALDAYFGSFSPVSVDPPGLTVRTCHFDDDPKRLLVGLINNDLFADWHGALRLRRAKAVSARELWRQQKLRPGQTIPLEVHAGDAAIIELRLPTPQP